jgi:2-deoxy-D-gluconate 3-dehydrogenase
MSRHDGPASSILSKFDVTGKNIVITGGNGGLGLNFAQSLAELGANIAAIDLGDKPSSDFVQLPSSGKHKYYQSNVADYENLKRTIDRIYEDFGSIDGW